MCIRSAVIDAQGNLFRAFPEGEGGLVTLRITPWKKSVVRLETKDDLCNSTFLIHNHAEMNMGSVA
jgi:hypothetical protein